MAHAIRVSLTMTLSEASDPKACVSQGRRIETNIAGEKVNVKLSNDILL